MGFFDDLETSVEEIPTGFGLPVGVYPVVLTDIKKHVKEGGGESTILTFSVNTAEDEDHRSGKEDIWLTKPVKGDKNFNTYASIGKQWFNNIGVTLEDMSSKDFELYNPDVKEKYVGVEGVLKVTEGNKGYTKKAFVKTAGESGVSEMATAGNVPAEKSEAEFDPTDW